MEENSYRSNVFLPWLQDAGIDPSQRQEWIAHQEMQMDFLLQRGLHSSQHVLDVACGPMRLGSLLIPFLREGWYFGQDINPRTLALGEQVLQRLGVLSNRYTLISSDDFSFPDVEDHSIDVAFSNSLFSHLSMNSILRCLLSVRQKLHGNGVYYSTFFLSPHDCQWLLPIPRRKWECTFDTHPCQDPFHYTEAMMASLAGLAGFRMVFDAGFGHPTQTMAVFRPQAA